VASSEEESAQRKLELEVRRSAEAKGLMENPLLVEALTNLRDVYTNHLIHSPVDKPQVREVARYRLEAITLFEQELRHILETGKMAAQSLAEEAEQRRVYEEDVKQGYG
jgi:hypothetical protein